jgi:dGTPase
MNWNNCFSGDRYGIKADPENTRTEFERDWDRIIFSSSFRRLQNKTQVFPLPEEVFVHNRLTHSLEVASVGRSLGKIVGKHISELPEVCVNAHSVDFYKNHLMHVISAACLAHDLGNPAFGHSGEEAISAYFINKASDLQFKRQFTEGEWADLIAFEGNSNAFRILTKQFNGRISGGFRLTYSTLGSILKYPCEALASEGKKGKKHRSKYGFFQADKPVFTEVVEKLNMIREHEGEKTIYKRHPFVYLVEAADDICYSIIDFEDAHRLKIFSTDYLIETFLSIITLNKSENTAVILETLDSVKDDNEKIAYLRAKSINYLTQKCAEVFIKHCPKLLAGTFEGDLINHDPNTERVMKEIIAKSVKYIYNYPPVVKIELAGLRIMSGLVQDFVEAALLDKNQRDKHHEKLLELIPSQYIFDESATPYQKVMSVIDFASGMTDLYALKLYRNLRGIEMPTI